jgi:cell division protein FtsB
MEKKKSFAKIWSYLFLFLVLGYLVFIFSKTVWKNYSINQQIYQLQAQNQVMQQENLQLKNLIIYYQSDSYKEWLARLLLNYKAPGEKVVAFPLDTTQITDFKVQTTSQTDSRSDLQKWYDFVFKKS